MDQPQTRYARNGDLHIAYQSIGEGGDQAVVFVTPSIFCTELMWEYAPPTHTLRELASLGRLVVFDRRGCGQSDPVERPATLEEQISDVLAVMDAAGIERAAVFAEADGNPMALTFAAVRPERVSHLLLHHPFARLTAAPDYPYGRSPDAIEEELVRPTVESWGTGAIGRVMAPTLAERDPEFLRWWARNERFAASPKTIEGVMRFFTEIDVRDVLPQVRVPTVVTLRPEGLWPGTELSRYVARRIPGASLVELPGRDSVTIGEGRHDVVSAFMELVTGSPPSARPDRTLATVLFTDIVDSTAHAARLGDARWRELLERHDAAVRAEADRHGGRFVKTTGDGALLTFDGPARAVRAAKAISDAVDTCGLEARCGVHTGEVELREGDVAGLAVHIGARVAALAGPGEVLVSKTVKDLVLGSGLEFSPRGEHELKGVPDRWPVFAATSG